MKYFSKISILLLFAISVFAETPHKSIKGLLDLSTYQYSSNNSVKLDGEWVMRWKQFDSVSVQTGDFKYLTVPGNWKPESTIFLDDAFGYATYSLRILISDTGKVWALSLPPIHSAYKLYANGNLVKQVGVPGTDKSMQAKVKSATVMLFVRDKIIDISIQVSNYNFIMGGILSSISIGSPKTITSEREHSIVVSGVLIGGLLIMSLYHFSLYLLWQKDAGFLYFAIICFFIALRETFVREALFFSFFQNIPHEISLKILYMCFPVSLGAIIMFFKNLYPVYNDAIKQVAIWISAIFIIVIIFTPNSFYARFLPVLAVTFILEAGYIMWLVIIKARVNLRKNILVLTGLLVLLLSIINDVLHEAHLIKTGFLLPIGFFLFTLFHAILLSIRFTHAFKRSETLSLTLAKKEIAYMEMQANFQQEVLNTQIEIQEQTFEHISREIHDNIGATLTLAKLNLYHNIPLNSKNEKLKDANNLISQALQDLRELSHSLNTSKIEELGLMAVLKREAELFEKRTAIRIDIVVAGEFPDLGAKKELILFRIIQEALTNIVKYAKATLICIRFERAEHILLLTVDDDGIGFDTKNNIVGNGLTNIKCRCKILNASFDILSRKNKGTRLIITLPYNGSN